MPKLFGFKNFVLPHRLSNPCVCDIVVTPSAKGTAQQTTRPPHKYNAFGVRCKVFPRWFYLRLFPIHDVSWHDDGFHSRSR